MPTLQPATPLSCNCCHLLRFADSFFDLKTFTVEFHSDLFLRVQKHCATSDTYWNMSAPQVLTRSGFGPQFSSSCDNSHIKINWEVPQKVPHSHIPHSMCYRQLLIKSRYICLQSRGLDFRKQEGGFYFQTCTEQIRNKMLAQTAKVSQTSEFEIGHSIQPAENPD